jgi:anti-anti-sigma factor
MDTPIDLQIEDIHEFQGAKIIRFTGDLDATNAEETLKSITELFEMGHTHIIADFQKLRYVNSTGLGILLHINRVATEQGGCFKIVNINENAYEIIEIIGASSLLEIYDDLEKAIASLN